MLTRCKKLLLKCTKFDFGWGSAPNLAEELIVLPLGLLAGFKGPPRNVALVVFTATSPINNSSHAPADVPHAATLEGRSQSGKNFWHAGSNGGRICSLFPQNLTNTLTAVI